MRITVNLDTHAATTSPSPLRVKAGSIAPVEIAFVRGGNTVLLAAGAEIEFGLKPKGKSDGDLLVYHGEFAACAGNVYLGNANCATDEFYAMLGIGDGDPANDKAQAELWGEIGWIVGDDQFRSQSFTVIAEPHLASGQVPSANLPPGAQWLIDGGEGEPANQIIDGGDF